MSRVSAIAIAGSTILIFAAGCAGTPPNPVALRQGDPSSTNSDRIICRKADAPTGSHISQAKEVCHTYAQWQLLEKQSQDVIRRGQHQPGQGGGG
ncbi:MAG TPA: hypothetical protein VL026_05490 [Rhizomicrobium sp.]|nr:hypothetical protein [Rhizomicrobium sp.]